LACRRERSGLSISKGAATIQPAAIIIISHANLLLWVYWMGH
jgi:hypothetical protein